MRRTRQQSPTHPRQCMQEIMQVRGAVSVVLVFTAAVLAYYNSLEAGFVFDDHRGILTNDDLDPSRTSLWDLFQHDFWGGSMSRVESHKSYRPLTVLSYRYLNFYFTERRPYGYHVVNVSMHAAVSVLFLTVCRLVLEGGGGRRGRAGVWSTFAALLFAVHSVHTEAVSARYSWVWGWSVYERNSMVCVCAVSRSAERGDVLRISTKSIVLVSRAEHVPGYSTVESTT